MKTGKRITIARIRDGPDPYPIRFTGRHRTDGEGQEDALRAPSKDRSQGGHQPSVVEMGYAGRFGAKKQTFNNRFHYSEEKRLWTKKKV